MNLSKTIEEEWERFRAEAVRFNPTPTQETALRQTFYAGAFAFFALFDAVVKNKHMSDREKCEQIGVLGAEAIKLAIAEVARS